MIRRSMALARRALSTQPSSFTFSAANFRDPKLPHGLSVLDVPCELATEQSLAGYGHLIHAADERTVDRQNFEIVRWPQPGWRALDPHTGDEAGTTEGHFDVHWSGDYFFGHNLAVATENNFYLDGLGTLPEHATRTEPAAGDGAHIYLWSEPALGTNASVGGSLVVLMRARAVSDYHPDGAQLFMPLSPIPFTVCLGLSTHGDDIRPEQMRAFRVPAGKGVYMHPSTWHNGVYVPPSLGPCRFLTRQGRVHARVSASWAAEWGTMLRVPLT